MSEEGLEPFEVAQPAEPEPQKAQRAERKGAAVAEKKYLCITVVDHNAVIEQTGEESYINLRIPVALAQSALKMVPEGKLGRIEPDLIVEMIEEGATGELINISEEKKTISIRVE